MGDYKEKVGEPTGEMSTVGRPIYKTPEGKMVSEQSTTFKYKDKWINIPTIHNGYSYNDDELRLMLDHDLLKPTSTHKNIKAAEKAAEAHSNTLSNFAQGGLTGHPSAMTADQYYDAEAKRGVNTQTEEALGLSSVPFFERPMDADESDRIVGEDEAGNLIRQTISGNRYFVSLNPDQRTARTKIEEDVIPAVKKFADNPRLPTKDEVVGAGTAIVKGAVETASIPGDILTGKRSPTDVQMGDVFELTGGSSAIGATQRLPENAVGSMVGARTKKKSEVSPLFKTIDSNRPDNIPNPLYQNKFNPNSGNKNPFYSSVYTALENLPVGKNGIKGNVAIKYLKKNAPNINMTELYWSGMLDNAPMRGIEDFLTGLKGGQKGIDPNKVYSKNELLYMADASVPQITVKRLSSKDNDNSPSWQSTQRISKRTNVLQPVIGLTARPPQTRVVTFEGEDNRIDSEYVELLIINQNSRGHKYRSADSHYRLEDKNSSLLAHVRGSYVPVLKEMGDPNDLLSNMASFGRKPTPINVFVIEELQSDAAQKERPASKQTSKEVVDAGTNPSVDFEEELTNSITDFVNSFGNNLPLTPKFNRMFNVDPNSSNADQRSAEKTGFKELSRVLTDAKNKLEGGTLRDRYEVAERLSDELTLLGGDMAPSAILRRTTDGDNPEEYIQEIQMNIIGDILFSKKVVRDQDLRTTMFSDIIYPTLKVDKQAPTDLTPAGLSDTIRASLLAVIRDAKQNKSHTIVVPPLEDIMRSHSLEEGPAKQTYQYSLTKVLRSLESETNGKISFKTGKVEGLEFGSKKNYLVINFNPSIVNDTKQARFAEGGSVSAMNNQTEMMLEEGGIADDGMNRDPVSGNQIPPGSMAKEVRDDVPANLSEGEYVVPADVVRFFGVKYFEDLRVQAKQGLQQMDKDGRIGGEPTTGAPPSGGGEISEEELMLILKEELGKEAPQGQPSPQPKPQPKPIGMMNKGGYASTSMASYRKNFNAGGVVNAAEGVDVNPKYVPSNRYGESNVGTGSGMTSVPYENDSGDVMYFTFINGRLYPRGITIPTGFRPMSGYEDLVPASQQVGPVTPTTTEPTPEVNKDSDPEPESTEDSSKWFEKNIELFEDPKSFIAKQLARGGYKEEAGLLSLFSSGLGLVSAAGNKLNDLGGIAQARAGFEIGKANGSIDPESEYSKNMETQLDALGGKFVASGNGLLNIYAKSLGFKNWEDSQTDNKKYLTKVQINRRAAEDYKFDRMTPEQIKAARDKNQPEAKKDGTSSYIDVSMAQQEGDSDEDYNKAVQASRDRAAADRATTRSVYDNNDIDTSTAAGIQDFKEKTIEAGGTWNTGGRAKGGLITKRKKKKKK